MRKLLVHSGKSFDQVSLSRAAQKMCAFRGLKTNEKKTSAETNKRQIRTRQAKRSPLECGHFHL